MTRHLSDEDRDSALARLDAAAAAQQLSPRSVNNIRDWLTETRLADYASLVAEHLRDGKWKQLDDVFFTEIPFGTGGRRGRMYPIGTNAINDRTIGESAQGLADYVKEVAGEKGELSCAIAYDTRHQSRHFAELCAEIMAAAGFRIYFLDDYRATPELSFLIRRQECDCGIMVTASHNPPSDNAVKVYWSSGGQLVPPHDERCIARVEAAQQIARTDFQQALTAGRIVVCTEETDADYIAAVAAQALGGPRDVKIIYSPLHGVGESAVRPVLQQAGFQDVEVFADHREPSGDFPNVPGHVSNPENARVFDAIIARAKEAGADIVLATDPDCDRMGCAAPLTIDSSGEWGVFNGNQLGALLCDYVLERRKQQGGLTKEHYVVETLVTTEMVRRIGDSYGVTTYGDLLVGFKWIAAAMDEHGADKFLFGTEESHGYLVGDYARDKDGAAACLLMSELAAQAKSERKSLFEKLDSLYWQHGYHGERQFSLFMEGAEGMQLMETLLALLRDEPPAELSGLSVVRRRDYQTGRQFDAGGKATPLAGPTGDLMFFDLAAKGNYVAVRPSGTEPKLKFYMFTFVPAEMLADLDDAKREMAERMDGMERDLRAFAGRVSGAG